MDVLNLLILCLSIQSIFLFIITDATISKSSKKSKSKNKKEKSLARLNVKDRDLVTTEVSAGEIIDNEWKYCEKEQNKRNWNNGEALAFVTPWNNHGYDIAKTFAKFTMISPVWLQIKRKPRGFYDIEGTHDIDRGWMKAVKEVNPKVKIVPRVLFDGWTASDYDSLFASEDEIESLIEKFVSTLREYKFQGAVIEIWSQVPASKHNDVVHLMTHVGEELKKNDLTSVLVIPPGVSADKKIVGFTKEHFKKLAPVIDYFSLMTYDFVVQSGEPGPNAPIDWVKACIQVLDPDSNFRSKILTGLNFYGLMYTKDGKIPVLGHQFRQMLQNFKPDLVWEPTVKEHYIQVTANEQLGKTIMFYPTLQSIHSRLELLKEMGTGVAIWEIGQGMDYFYDLL